MSEHDGQNKGRNFTFKDREQIEKLLKLKKLTERQNKALEHLYSSYNFMIKRGE